MGTARGRRGGHRASASRSRAPRAGRTHSTLTRWAEGRCPGRCHRMRLGSETCAESLGRQPGRLRPVPRIIVARAPRRRGDRTRRLRYAVTSGRAAGAARRRRQSPVAHRSGRRPRESIWASEHRGSGIVPGHERVTPSCGSCLGTKRSGVERDRSLPRQAWRLGTGLPTDGTVARCHGQSDMPLGPARD